VDATIDPGSRAAYLAGVNRQAGRIPDWLETIQAGGNRTSDTELADAGWTDKE